MKRKRFFQMAMVLILSVTLLCASCTAGKAQPTAGNQARVNFNSNNGANVYFTGDISPVGLWQFTRYVCKQA